VITFIEPPLFTAYLDPGTAGTVYQVGYFIFYGLLALAAIFMRQIKAFVRSLKARFGGARSATEPSEAGPPAPEPSPAAAPPATGAPEAGPLPVQGAPEAEPPAPDAAPAEVLAKDAGK